MTSEQPYLALLFLLTTVALAVAGLVLFVFLRARRHRREQPPPPENAPWDEMRAENDRLRQENNRLNYDMIVLYQFVNNLGCCRSTEAVCREFINTVQQSIDPDVSGLFLLSPDGTLQLTAHHGLSGLATTAFEVGRGVVGWVAANGREILISDAEKDPRFPELNGPGFAPYFHTAICLPLLFQNKVLGVTIVGRASGSFTQDELRLLFIIANEGSLYLQNLRLYEEVARLAIEDGPTGLYNHRYFYEQLEILLSAAKKTGEAISLLMIDIDFFKPFNDRYGHQTGDAILREVARLIRQNVEERHLVARYGGEEFAVIMPGTDSERAYEIAERIRTRIKEYPFQTQDGEYAHVTVSIGLATWPVDLAGKTNSVNDLVAAADDQLVVFAKNGGRDRVCRPDYRPSGGAG